MTKVNFSRIIYSIIAVIAIGVGIILVNTSEFIGLIWGVILLVAGSEMAIDVLISFTRRS